MRERQMVIGIDPAHGEDCGATMIAHIDGDVLVMDEFSAFSPEFVELLSRCFGREQATTWERAIEDYDPLPEDEIDPVSAQMRWIAGNTMRGESPLVEASRQMVNAERLHVSYRSNRAEIVIDFEDLDSEAIENIARDYSGRLDARRLPEEDS